MRIDLTNCFYIAGISYYVYNILLVKAKHAHLYAPPLACKLFSTLGLGEK